MRVKRYKAYYLTVRGVAGLSAILYMLLAMWKVETQLPLESHPSIATNVDVGSTVGRGTIWTSGRSLLSKDKALEMGDGRNDKGLNDGFSKSSEGKVKGEFDMPNRDGFRRFIAKTLDDKEIAALPPPDLDEEDDDDDFFEEEEEEEEEMRKLAVRKEAKEKARKAKEEASVRMSDEKKKKMKKQKTVSKYKGREEIKKISKFVYSTVKRLKAKSIIDCPCSAHLAWTPDLVRRLKKEIPGFKYHCLDSSSKALKHAKEEFNGVLPKMKFSKVNLAKSRLPKADLAISWGGLDHESTSTQYRYIDNVRRSGIKYVFLGHYPAVNQDDEEKLEAWNDYSKKNHLKRVNLKKSPFMFPEPDARMEGVVKSYSPPKELYLFSSEKLHNRFA